MKRRIVSISGQFALADDGSCWMWTDTGWKPWGRGELPESEGVDYYQTTSSPPWPTTQGVPEKMVHVSTFHADGTRTEDLVPVAQRIQEEKTATVVGVLQIKRGPGRPRKVQP